MTELTPQQEDLCRQSTWDFSHLRARDDWPAIFELVQTADILVLCTAIWLGEKSSVCTQVIERLYGNSHLLKWDAGCRFDFANPEHR